MGATAVLAAHSDVEISRDASASKNPCRSVSTEDRTEVPMDRSLGYCISNKPIGQQNVKTYLKKNVKTEIL